MIDTASLLFGERSDSEQSEEPVDSRGDRQAAELPRVTAEAQAVVEGIRRGEVKDGIVPTRPAQLYSSLLQTQTQVTMVRMGAVVSRN